MNYSVFDIYGGLLLKLGENKEVLGAFNGRYKLDREMIELLYGSPPIFIGIEWPSDEVDVEEDIPKCIILGTYFLSCKAIQLLLGVELIADGKVEKSYRDLAHDFMETHYR